ncbi:MAG: hypothetical protein WBA45_07210 [Microthrixaceae bacterium]
MSGQRRRSKGRKPGAGGKQQQQQQRQNRAAAPAEFWRSAPEPPEPEDIVHSDHPTALIRSMDTPPLPGQGSVADHYFAAVIERAAGLATALAASADLLDDGED